MSYSKQTWSTGDTVTAAKLNHMEDGIEGAAQDRGVLYSVLQIESLQNDPSWLDANLDLITGNDVYDAVMAGKRLAASVQFWLDGAWVTAGNLDMGLATMSWDKSANDGHGVGTITVVSPTIDVSSLGVNGFAFISFNCNGYGTESEDVYFSGGTWNIVPKVPNKYVVTLTPTELDYSGTMDKTVDEINTAYEAGKEIWFNVFASGMSVTFPLADVNKSVNALYPSFDAVIWNAIDDVVIRFSTEFTDDGTKDTYATTIYALTPAS